MDSSFRIIASERSFDSLLIGENGGNGTKPSFSLPPGLQEAISNARPAELASMRVTLPYGRTQYKCRLFRLHSHGGLLPGSLFALHFRLAEDATDKIGEFSAAFHLTGREEETLRGIAEGLSSKELADRMGINANTVKSFLRLIMIKLGVRRRGEVLAKLFNYDVKMQIKG